jgi:hypothetical protein
MRKLYVDLINYRSTTQIYNYHIPAQYHFCMNCGFLLVSCSKVKINGKPALVENQPATGYFELFGGKSVEQEPPGIKAQGIGHNTQQQDHTHHLGIFHKLVARLAARNDLI